jgi:hypothetical protein
MDDDDKLIYNDDSATLSWLGFGKLLVGSAKYEYN